MSESAALLMTWYAANARDLPWRAPPGTALPADADWPYRVWLSEVMLQQTTVAAVKPYFANFTARWPNLAALAAADDAEVMAAWAGLGYYARARNLLACAKAVVTNHGGRFPSEEPSLRTLPGIGDYTAAAVAAFGFGQRAIVIDGNIERVITRLFAISAPLPAARTAIRAALEAIVPAAAGDFAQGLMDLGSRICTPRDPACPACPIRSQCAAFARGNPQAFPVKVPKRARPVRYGTAWWLVVGNEVLTVIRPARGLLGGMRALPACNWHGPGAPPPLPGDWEDLGAVAHGFTHFELVLTLKALRLAARPALAGDWIAVAHIGAAGLPTLFDKAARLALAQKHETEAA